MGSNDDAMTLDWDNSYGRRENFIFWPADETIRFVSRYLRKRVGLDSVQDVIPGAGGSKVLDLGCGIGRHIHFGIQMGLDMHGIELSKVAVDVARQWMKGLMNGAEEEKILAGDVRSLPWQDGYFDHALSDSVLDSMGFEIAKQGVAELARVIKPGGLLYCNVIAEKDGSGRLASEERIVATRHEQGTIQSYFDREKIDGLFDGRFELLRLELHGIEDHLKGSWSGRWHMVMRRK